ncbi:MAG TPA: PqiC family protein [Thermoanaerobaculia bacterium]|nr:PqiC family protein [Thermoanaerobaculia bacterium]
MSAVMWMTLLVAGCGFFKRTPNQFYSLQPVPGTMVNVGGTPVGIDGVELPPGLDRRGVVIRGENHKLDERGQHQWASSLEDMVIHTLAFDLANRLPQGMVVLPGQAKPAEMRSIYVTFADLAPGQDRVFVLDATWALMPGDRSTRERITVTAASLDPPAVVAAMNQALAQLADRIAAGL